MIRAFSIPARRSRGELLRPYPIQSAALLDPVAGADQFAPVQHCFGILQFCIYRTSTFRTISA
jgi:hypothetical protein